MQIAILSHTKHLDDTELESIAEALEIQANQHFAPAWETAQVKVEVYDAESDVPHGAPRIVFFDHADQAGALGYHTETPNNRPYAKVFVGPIVDNGGGVLDTDDDGNGVSVTASHELLELLGDPDCEQWVDGPAIDEGSAYAREVCDPVQQQAYAVKLSDGQTEVAVSNFVYPDWFNEEPDDDAALDYMEVLETPFTLAEGGYMQVRGEPGSEKDVWENEDAVPEWQRASKQHHAARAAKRKGRLKHHHHHHHGG